MSLQWITHSSPIALCVLAMLLLFSIVSWAIVIVKYFSLRRAEKTSSEFADLFWKLRRLDDVSQASVRLRESPLAKIFQRGYQELIHARKEDQGLESVEHALRKASLAEMKDLESLVPFLATVGSTSPFIGLFGTVVGIMSSFHDIGVQGSASLATVAPGIAEALVATAAGLLAAIPAVIAYNYFAVRLRSFGSEMESFSSDFLNVAKRHL